MILQPAQVIGPNGIRLLSGAARVTIRWPRWIRLGESAPVGVIVNPESQSAGEIFSIDPQVLNIESRLDVLGARLSPPGIVSVPGRIPAYFTWTLAPLSRDNVVGQLWVWLRLNRENVPLAVQAFSMDVLSLGGVSQSAILWAGWIGAVLGMVLSFPNVERWVFNTGS